MLWSNLFLFIFFLLIVSYMDVFVYILFAPSSSALSVYHLVKLVSIFVSKIWYFIFGYLPISLKPLFFHHNFMSVSSQIFMFEFTNSVCYFCLVWSLMFQLLFYCQALNSDSWHRSLPFWEILFHFLFQTCSSFLHWMSVLLDLHPVPVSFNSSVHFSIISSTLILALGLNSSESDHQAIFLVTSFHTQSSLSCTLYYCTLYWYCCYTQAWLVCAVPQIFYYDWSESCLSWGSWFFWSSACKSRFMFHLLAFYNCFFTSVHF